MEKEKNAIEWYQMGLEHGRTQQAPTSQWVRSEDEKGKEQFNCGNCKRGAKYNSMTGWELCKYCPECGAKMR